MWYSLSKDLEAQATRQIRDFERYRKRTHDENVRRARRSSGTPHLELVHRPSAWSLDPGFDPFHVRARAVPIGHAVTRALRGGGYQPHRPAGFFVPKVGGGSRLVNSYPIVDSLLSNRLYRSLLEKNRPRLSARSYAYRGDLGPHDAIMHLQSEWGTEQRIFVAEYDFSKFFDHISHDHIWRTIESLGFIMTPLEERLLRAFLASPEPYTNTTEKALPTDARTVGVPQGTSISLLIANLAATPLDRSLERLGVGFVRYADDTLIWSRDYAAVCEAVHALHAAAEEIGSPINYEKSEGVRLFVSEGTRNAEMRSTSRIEYLGHSIGLRDVRMKQAVVDKIKSHVSSLILNNLLREPIAGTQSLARLTGNDRDYATLIWQLRRYLYGPLSESQVRRFQQGAIPPMTFEGVMSFFPLVNDQAALRELDSWIATQVWLAIRKRANLLKGSVTAFPEPWTRERQELFRLVVTSTRTGKRVDLRLPSVERVSSVIHAAVLTHGTKVVGSGHNLYLYEA